MSQDHFISSYGNQSIEPFGNLFKLPDAASKIPVLAKMILCHGMPNRQINDDIENRYVQFISTSCKVLSNVDAYTFQSQTN